MLKFLSEFGPLIAFFIGYKYAGIKGATIYMIATSTVGIALCYFIDRKIHTFSLVSFGVLLISASITLISGNSMFIKMKPTILYLIFAFSFLLSALQKKPLIKTLLNSAFQVQEKCWYILSYRFAIFFVVMAIINEMVWRNFDELFWVKFKVFGALPVTLLFILLQIPILLRYKINENTK